MQTITFPFKLEEAFDVDFDSFDHADLSSITRPCEVPRMQQQPALAD